MGDRHEFYNFATIYVLYSQLYMSANMIRFVYLNTIEFVNLPRTS